MAKLVDDAISIRNTVGSRFDDIEGDLMKVKGDLIQKIIENEALKKRVAALEKQAAHAKTCFVKETTPDKLLACLGEIYKKPATPPKEPKKEAVQK